MSYHRIQTEAWLKTIEVKADRVLDVGGAQLPVKGRTKSWEVGEYKILDLEKPHEANQKVDIIQDLSDIDSKSNIDCWESFDVAFCIEVSEYWFDPMLALVGVKNYLKEGGILYITFPFIYMAHKPEGTDFLRYTPIGAEKLLKEAGFEILEHKYRTATSDKLLPFWKEEGMKGLTGADHNIIGSMIKAKKYDNSKG